MTGCQSPRSGFNLLGGGIHQAQSVDHGRGPLGNTPLYFSSPQLPRGYMVLTSPSLSQSLRSHRAPADERPACWPETRVAICSSAAAAVHEIPSSRDLVRL